MDPNQPKQERVENPINFNSIPSAKNSTVGGENPENAAGQKSLSIDEARHFSAWLRSDGSEPAIPRDPIDLAQEKFITLSQKLIVDFDKLSVEEQKSRTTEVLNAEDYLNTKLEEEREYFKEEQRKALEEEFAEEDELTSSTAISSGKVLATLRVGYTDCAMVEIGTMKNGKCYQVFNAELVDQTQLKSAPNYDDINPKKISRAQAARAFAAGYRGGPETLLSTFNIGQFLEPKLPKNSSLSDASQRRKARTTMWMMGHLNEEIVNGKPVRSGLWMMPKSKWEAMKPSTDKQRIYELSVGRAIRQFQNYQKSLKIEVERNFNPERTPFRAASESAQDWRQPSRTPQPKETPDRDLSEEPPVSGGGQDGQDDENDEDDQDNANMDM